MAQRTVATPAAEQAARQMIALLDGALNQQVEALIKACQVLADAQMWDGSAAARFRSVEWPARRSQLLHAELTLRELSGHVQHVIADIMRAGAEPVPAHRPGAASAGTSPTDSLWDDLLDEFNPFEQPGRIGRSLWTIGWAATAIGSIDDFLSRTYIGKHAKSADLTSLQRIVRFLRDKGWLPGAGSEADRAFWKASGKWAGKAGNVLPFALAAYSQWATDSHNKSLDMQARIARAEWNAWLVGGPVAAGDLVGGFLGCVVGGIIGSTVGQWVSDRTTNLAGQYPGIVGALIGGPALGYVLSFLQTPGTLSAVEHAADAVGHAGSSTLHTIESWF